MRVTKNPKQHKDGSRPAVLYTSVQHAREWLAGETNRRQLRLFLDNYGREGTAIGTDGQPVEGVSAEELTKLVNTRELWFVLSPTRTATTTRSRRRTACGARTCATTTATA